MKRHLLFLLLLLSNMFCITLAAEKQLLKQNSTVFLTWIFTNLCIKTAWPTESERLTCRVLSLRPFKKMGKLTKLLYFVTTSERDATACNHTQWRIHVFWHCSYSYSSRPLTLSSEENSLQSSLRCSTIFVPCWTPLASAISNTPELRKTTRECLRITFGCSHTEEIFSNHWCLNKKTLSLLSSTSHPSLSPVWGPLVSGCAGLGGPGVDVNTVGYHEGRVESHTKLTNDGAAGLCLVLQGIQKCLQHGKRWFLWETFQIHVWH